MFSLKLSKAFATCLPLIALLSYAPAHAETTIQFTTMNIEWFGLKVDDPRGKQPTPKNPEDVARRNAAVQDFFATIVHPKDVVVLEEIVDLDALKTILPKGWNCAGYKPANPLHQKVVICASPSYKLMKVPYDDNATIEEVATDTEWSRPAVRLDLADLKGNTLMRIVGVHLKSGPQFSRERQRQAGVIAADLAAGGSIPTILMGDFNTFTPQSTHAKKADADLIEDALKTADPSFTHLKHSVPYTYRSGSLYGQFDQMFLNSGVQVVNGPNVFPVCNQTKNGNGYYNIATYNQLISDHCPVTVTVSVK